MPKSLLTYALHVVVWCAVDSNFDCGFIAVPSSPTRASSIPVLGAAPIATCTSGNVSVSWNHIIDSPYVESAALFYRNPVLQLADARPGVRGSLDIRLPTGLMGHTFAVRLKIRSTGVWSALSPFSAVLVPSLCSTHAPKHAAMGEHEESTTAPFPLEVSGSFAEWSTLGLIGSAGCLVALLLLSAVIRKRGVMIAPQRGGAHHPLCTTDDDPPSPGQTTARQHGNNVTIFDEDEDDNTLVLESAASKRFQDFLCRREQKVGVQQALGPKFDSWLGGWPPCVVPGAGPSQIALPPPLASAGWNAASPPLLSSAPRPPPLTSPPLLPPPPPPPPLPASSLPPLPLARAGAGQTSQLIARNGGVSLRGGMPSSELESSSFLEQPSTFDNIMAQISSKQFMLRPVCRQAPKSTVPAVNLQGGLAMQLAVELANAMRRRRSAVDDEETEVEDNDEDLEWNHSSP